MKPRHLLLLACMAALSPFFWVTRAPAAPATSPAHGKPTFVLPDPGKEELRMQRLYQKKYPYMGAAHADEVLEAGRWTRYYAKKVGLEKYMATLLCMWHVESNYRNVPGEDGKSFGRTQTCYDYPKNLRKWWADRGEVLREGDDAVSTQMAYGVAEVWMKSQGGTLDIWTTVRRYNGCGTGAVNYAKKVFAVRDRVYGLHAPTPKPSVCPTHARRKKRAKQK